MTTLPPKQRERIMTTFGLNGQSTNRHGYVAEAEQRGLVTIRSSIRRGMAHLGALIRPQVEHMLIEHQAAPQQFPGDPLFWERVDRSGDCWRWIGTVDNGYPVFKRNGKKHMATRYVYELFNGPIPDGHHITHTCADSDPLCVRPEHLLAALPSEIAGSPLRHRRA